MFFMEYITIFASSIIVQEAKKAWFVFFWFFRFWAHFLSRTPPKEPLENFNEIMNQQFFTHWSFID